MKGKWVFWAKVVILLVVAGVVGWKLYVAWRDVSGMHLAIDWRWGGIAIGGFAGSMLTSSLVLALADATHGRPLPGTSHPGRL